MELLNNLLDSRLPILLVFLFLLIIGFLIFISGIKNFKANKSVGIILLILGAVFSLSMLYLLVFSFVFGFNS